MQLSIAFVASLMASSAAYAAPTSATSSSSLNVPLSRRGHLFTQPDSNELDWNKLTSHLDRLRSKYEASFQNYEKNVGKKASLDRMSSSTKRDTGNVPLTDQSDELLWTGKISFGGQAIDIDFDTGSADTLVNPGAYTPGSTAKNTGTTFSTAYGDGTTARGTVYTDNLEIGGLKASNAAIGRSRSNFVENGANGISGMAYPSLARFNSKYPPYFDTLLKAGVLDDPVFTFKLRKSGSALTLGSAAASDISYVDVDQSQGFWSVPAKINGQSITSIVDTGTTVIVGPTDQVSDFFSSLDGVQSFTQQGQLYGAYDCSSPPDVTFQYGDAKIQLSEDTVTFGTTNTGECVLSVIGQDLGIDGWVTGDSLLQNTIAVFDRGQNRVGFGN